MRIATCTLSSLSPYSQSRPHETPMLERERHDDYEERTWREKSHATPDGHVFIPPMAFKMAVDFAASMLSMKRVGRSTYTKFFLSGVLVMDPLVLPFTKEDARRDRIYCNADGRRGSGTRVWRNFPTFDEWRGDVIFHVLADEITEKVFEPHLVQAGAFCGIGRFRPQNGGFYGRFQVEEIKWS